MSEQWYYARAGKQAGPVSAAELKQLASAGQLSPTDHVWKNGMAKWEPATKVKGLFSAPVAPMAQAIPPSPGSRASANCCCTSDCASTAGGWDAAGPTVAQYSSRRRG